MNRLRAISSFFSINPWTTISGLTPESFGTHVAVVGWCGDHPAKR